MDLYRSAKDLIVRTQSPEGGVGSGFIISNGKENLIVTADHNLDDKNSRVSVLHKGKSYTASAVTRDNDHDIAILKFDEKLKNPPRKFLEPSAEVPIGNTGVVTIGFPGGIKAPVISPGFIMGRDSFYTEQTVINATQPCDYGSSGGVQLRADGRWWGVQQAVGPRYGCVSLGAADVIPLIQQIPGWERYGTGKK